jgi:hypothetical protein
VNSDPRGVRGRQLPAGSPATSYFLPLLVAMLFICALMPRLYHVRSPFMNFSDHNSAMYSMFARNYLDHGLLATRLGQVRTMGPVEPDSLTFFAHHPPTIALITAMNFGLFGLEEWAARAAPILASALTAPVLFLLGRRIFGSWWSLQAGILFAWAPGAIYYGRMLAHEAFVLFGGLLCLFCWCRFVESGKRSAWFWTLFWMAATTFIDWPGTYLLPAILVASALTPGFRTRIIRMAVEGAAVLGSSIVLIGAHIILLKGSFQDMAEAFNLRVFSTTASAFTWGEYLDGVWRSLAYFLTRPGRTLATAGLLAVAIVLAIRAANFLRGAADPASRKTEGSRVRPLAVNALNAAIPHGEQIKSVE